MAEQGYWVVCEDLHAGDRDAGEPALCMAHVDGFHYTDAMGGSRMEVLATIKKKLKDNIDFLLACYNDVPPPATSDEPPEDKSLPGAAHLFVSLGEIGVVAEMLTPMML